MAILAVAPDHQRRGLGRALLHRAFTQYAEAGLTRAELGVLSVNDRARALYERSGMRPRFTLDVVERAAA